MTDRIPLVGENGDVLGATTRREAHGDPSLLHPVVHCLVQNAAGDILLQLRSRNKDIQPGRWDTSVGGHVDLGETIEAALVREMEEEIGLRPVLHDLRFLYRYVMRGTIESELVHTFTCVCDGPFQRQESEIDALRFWPQQEIQAALGCGVFTPNFEDEFARFQRA